VSTGLSPDAGPQAIEQERRRIGRHLDEVGRLAESEAPPQTFFGEMLKRLLDALAAPAGAVWMFTSNGNLQLQFHVNMAQVGLDKTEQARQTHEELLRLAVTQPKPLHLLPRSGLGTPAAEGKLPPGNPTDFMLLLVPILQGDKLLGLLEIWQGPQRPLNAVPGFLQYMGLMADLCARYLRHQRMGQLAGQQQLWTQLEAFARQVHGSLKPMEVAYVVANEGRRLIECDRVCVALRQAGSTSIEAVSGADVVEKRSALIKLMRTLADKVMKWGEKLVFTGAKDDSLPPAVLDALDAYLAESNSKLLVVMPLKDEREKDIKGPPRSALVMECFEPPEDPQQHLARLEVIAKHAAPALYNAVEYRRIPMRFLWLPLAKLRDGVGGQTKALAMLIVLAMVSTVTAAVVVPYPLKMEATGSLLPQTRRWVYAPEEGTVLAFDVGLGETFNVPESAEAKEIRPLARMYSRPLEEKYYSLKDAIATAEKAAQSADDSARNLENIDKKRADDLHAEASKQREVAAAKKRELAALMARTFADETAPGYYRLQPPPFTSEESKQLRRREWTVLNQNFREEWVGRSARPSDPLIRLGAKDGPWEIELRIPQKHIGKVLEAYHTGKNDEVKELDVDFLLLTDPTKTYKGKLPRDKISFEANPQKKDDSEEIEPVVVAYVRIDGADIPPESRLPRDQLLAGANIKAKVRCGNHPIGYSLLYGVWEFLYEKVLFYF
jgi:hypothetical protein